MTRRDKCFKVGTRMDKLSPGQASAAWFHLSEQIESMGDMDLPKFKHLLEAVWITTIRAEKIDPNVQITK